MNIYPIRSFISQVTPKDSAGGIENRGSASDEGQESVVEDESLSVGFVHGSYEPDGLLVEEERQPEHVKLPGPDRLPKRQADIPRCRV